LEEHLLLYVAYLDEFGHIGPFISRGHPSYKTSPVFGLGGIVLPFDRVRRFATWFFKLKCNLLAYEIARDDVPPARWEKKGAALVTTRNFEAYPELRRALFRILAKLKREGGFAFYQGIAKHRLPAESSSEQLYSAVLRFAIQKLNKHCLRDGSEFIIVLDESDPKFHRDVIIRQATLTMFGQDSCSRLIEPPFQVASHLYQTLQCADWLCGLIGRLGAYDAEPVEFADYAWAQIFFGDRLASVSKVSNIRSKAKGVQLRNKWTSSRMAGISLLALETPGIVQTRAIDLVPRAV
jgi:hypothetical protein